MLVVSNLSKTFAGAESPLFKSITFTVNGGERVGLIGPNGSGKSTLLKIIMGEMNADKGSVIFTPPNIRIGYLAQGLTVPDETPVSAVLNPHSAEVERLAAAMESAQGEELNTLLNLYGEALEKLEWGSDSARLLAQLGLQNVPLEMPVGVLSGGQKTRLVLASMLINQPQLLILDEPTNHLDITALEWLEQWLMEFDGGVLIVSHDRAFLDRVVNRVVAIETGTARIFEGGYSDYMEAIRSEQHKKWSRWRDQQVEIERLKTDAQQTMAKAIRKENATRDSTQRRYAKKVAKRAKAKEKRLERYLESDERVEKPEQTWGLKLDLDELPRVHGDALTLENLSIGYDAPLVSNITVDLQAGERVAVMGPNGHGKTTLLKTIIGQLEPLSGRIRLGGGIQVGYLAQEQDILDPDSNPMLTIQAEAGMNETEARSFLHFFLFAGDDSLRPIAQLSYGERARLMLARLVARGANLLVLDEPLNHLDLPSREKFEQALDSFPGSVLAVAHDRYFVDHFADKIWFVENGALTVEPILEVVE